LIAMNIELNIQELVLHGFPHGDKYRIAQAVQHELTNMFSNSLTDNSLLESGEYYRIDAGQFELQSDEKSEQIGSHIANAVYGGLLR
jgi:hypothetical protein